MVRVFSLKSTSLNMWIMRVYIMGVKTWCIRYDKIAKQNVLRVSCGNTLLAKYLWKLAVTNCHDSSHFRYVLSTWLHFAGSLLVKNPLIFNVVLSLHTFCHTQPIQWNPTQNTRYIRLNKITIKFGSELKPTQTSCK